MLSLRLWALFVAFTVRRLFARRSPRLIGTEEDLGREIFSSKLFSSEKGSIKLGAFEPPRGRNDISITRIGLIPRHLGQQIGFQHSKKRGRTFYGFAELRANRLQGIEGVSALGAPTFENAFHANINLPPDVGRDQILDTARRLAAQARFTPAEAAD